MPWTPADAERHKKNLSPKQQRQWSHVANAMLASCLKAGGSQAACEGRAIRAANAAVGSPVTNDAIYLAPASLWLNTAQVRYTTFNRARYLVAPAVPLIAGVLNQHLVAAEDIAEVLPSWQGLPVPLNHPMNDYGDPISANSPEVLETIVGRFFHPRFESEKLSGEVWLHTERCARFGGDALDMLQRIEAGTKMEISTAFYAKTLARQGLYKGTQYIGQLVQLRPDHVALLPNSIGACSLEHGCGVHALHAHCNGACTCEEGDAAMEIDAEEKHPGKLRQALRTLFAFANDPEPEPEEEPAPADAPRPDDDDTPDDDTPDPVLPFQPEEVTTPDPKPPPPPPMALKGERMLTKPELITRLVAHAHTAWTEEQAPGLQAYEERMLEQMLAEADRRQQEAPLTLKALQTELGTRDQALRAEYDQKLATHVQQLEEKQEREHLLAYFTQRGWTPDETALLPVPALRRMHQELDPVSYLGNGMPRLSAQAVDDSLPDNDPKYE